MSQSNVLVGKTAVFQHVRLKAASPLTTPDSHKNSTFLDGKGQQVCLIDAKWP